MLIERIYWYIDTNDGQDAWLASICAGLPTPWTHEDIGGRKDQFQFACVPLVGDGTITMWFVPPISSQFSKFGLMMRETRAPDAAHVFCLLAPRFHETGIERPGWHASLLTRSSTGVATTLAGQSTDLSAAYAAQVRLTQLCYLKLERSRNLFTASLSPDGRAWSVVATAKLSFQTKLLAGLSASSCRAKVTTTVRFDHVTVVPKNARELK